MRVCSQEKIETVSSLGTQQLLLASRAPGSNDDDDMFFTTPHVPWGKTRVGKASTRSQEGVMRDLKYVVVISSPQENYVS